MISDVLKLHGITSGASKTAQHAGLVEYGYAQVEPNHLSAQRTGQIYAQLPADPEISVLENGQFVDYDYAAGLVKLPGGVLEPMLVFNEIKLYREHQLDCEFAMLKDNYNARIYSPLDPETLNWTKQSRFYNHAPGDTIVAKEGTYTKVADDAVFDNTATYYTKDNEVYAEATGLTEFAEGTVYYTYNNDEVTYPIDDVTAAPDMYEIHYNEEPWHIESRTKGKKMPENTTMVPRVFKTNIGDHYTTNAVKINADDTDLAAYATTPLYLYPNADGFLGKTKTLTNVDMTWQVVKFYTLPDRQKAVKVLRIK